MAMEPKTVEIDGKTYMEMQDGKPVYMDGDREVALDPVGMHGKIGELNREGATRRKVIEKLEADLSNFADIDDPAAAKKALETIKNFDQKKLVDAGEVERIKAEAIRAVEDKYKPQVEELGTLKTQLIQEKIGNAFAQSKFIQEKVAVPPDMIQKTFGDQFAVEDGRLVAKDKHGNPIFSTSNPGDHADFDEALERIVEAYPYRDNILKGRQQEGGGARGAGNGAGGKNRVTRTEFERIAAADPARARQMLTKDGIEVVD